MTTVDHPRSDPGDGRSECARCGKWVWPAIHSCKGVPVTDAARARIAVLGPSWDTVRHFLVTPAARCTCGTPGTGNYEGPQRDCPTHGEPDPLARCPFCAQPTAGPLAGCDNEECTQREIEVEAKFKRLEDE